jgi:hypothetical protein
MRARPRSSSDSRAKEGRASLSGRDAKRLENRISCACGKRSSPVARPSRALAGRSATQQQVASKRTNSSSSRRSSGDRGNVNTKPSAVSSMRETARQDAGKHFVAPAPQLGRRQRAGERGSRERSDVRHLGSCIHRVSFDAATRRAASSYAPGTQRSVAERRPSTRLAVVAASTPARRPPTSPTASPANSVEHRRMATDATPRAIPPAVRHLALPAGTKAASAKPTRTPAPRHAPGIVQQSPPAAIRSGEQQGRRRDIGSR